jgi:hypothetical protein
MAAFGAEARGARHFAAALLAFNCVHSFIPHFQVLFTGVVAA